MSQEDIAAGQDWSSIIDDRLDNALFGIICVTPDNQSAPWLNYEAGAIAKAVNGVQARVAPLLIDFAEATELVGPLKKFQSKPATKEGIFSIVRSINSILDQPRDPNKLDDALSDMWPRLERRLTEIDEAKPAPKEKSRTEKDMVIEILSTVRDISRQMPSIVAQAPETDTRPALSNSELQGVRKKILDELAGYFPAEDVKMRYNATHNSIIISTPIPVPHSVQTQLKFALLATHPVLRQVRFLDDEVS